MWQSCKLIINNTCILCKIVHKDTLSTHIVFLDSFNKKQVYMKRNKDILPFRARIKHQVPEASQVPNPGNQEVDNKTWGPDLEFGINSKKKLFFVQINHYSELLEYTLKSFLSDWLNLILNYCGGHWSSI